jgi:hypothetical protein
LQHSKDPLSGQIKRHQLVESILQEPYRRTARVAGIGKHGASPLGIEQQIPRRMGSSREEKLERNIIVFLVLSGLHHE